METYVSAEHQGCAADDPRRHPYLPTPDPSTGNLAIDPEIELKAKGFGLNISFLYNTNSTADAEFGKKRSASVAGRIVSGSSGNAITIVRGDGTEVPYQKVGGVYKAPDNRPVVNSVAMVGGNFVETFPDGMQMTYSALNGSSVTWALASVADASGNTQTYAYSGDLLQSITVPGGRKVTFTYDTGSPTSLLTGVEDWANRRWTLQYDGSRQLTTITSPMGCATKYHYDANGRVDAVDDPRGYRSSYAYDASGRVVSMAAGAAVWTWTYVYTPGATTIAYTEMTTPSGAKTTYHYDSATGLLAREQKPEGYTVTYAYHAKGFRIREETPAGVVCSATYGTTANGWWVITAQDDALGYRTSMGYDANGNLTTLTDALGTVTTFGYSGDGSTHLRIRQTDPLGRVTAWTYSLGLVETITDGRGLVTSLAYDTYGSVESVTGPDGKRTTFGYDTLGRQTTAADPLGRVTTSTWDDGDNRTSVTNAAGEKTTYVYDAGLLAAVVNPLNQRTTFTYGRYGNKLTEEDALNHVTSWSYDTMGFLETLTDPLGYVSTLVYNTARQHIADIDQLGCRTSYTYDDAGRRETVQDARNNVTTTVYNARRNVIAVIDSRGYRTSSGYDAVGRQVTITDALNHVTTTVYDDAGQAIAAIDAAGYRTTTSFDASGNRVSMIDALQHVTTWAYETDSNRLWSTENALGHRVTHFYDDAGQQTAIQDARGYRTSFTYDLAGRLETEQDALGYVTSHVYDAAGRQTAVIDAKGRRSTTVYDAAGRVSASQDALGYLTSYTYDAAGRRTAVQDAIGRLTSTVYDAAGRVTETIDAAGHRTSFGYDAVGNRVTITDALGHVTTHLFETNSNQLSAIVNALGHIVSFTYDQVGRQTAVQDARGNRTSLGYDSVGRLQTETNPLGYITSHAYDATGRETVRTDANGHAKTMAYDAIGRMVSIVYANGQRATYQYDPTGNATTIEDWNGTVTQTFSARGELTGKILPGGLRLTLAYDSVGNRTTITEPDGYSYTYGFDELDRCIRLRDPNAYVFTFAYDAVGRRTTLLDSTGLTRTYEYSVTDRLTTQIDWSSGNPIVTFLDGYDAVGNRTSRIKDGVACTWVYDEIYRLTEQQKSGQAATFAYDQAGNLLVKHHEGSNSYTFTYDAANRPVTSIQGSSQLTSFTHDANGNLTNERCDTLGTLLTWVYDNEDRLLNELRPSGANHTFAYHENGLRWSSHQGGSAHLHNYIWVDQDVINDYIDGVLGARLDVVDGDALAIKQGANRYAYVPDPIGNVNHLLDTSLNKVATYGFWPYGELQTSVGVETSAQLRGVRGYDTGATNRVWVPMSGFYRPDLGRMADVRGDLWHPVGGGQSGSPLFQNECSGFKMSVAGPETKITTSVDWDVMGPVTYPRAMPIPLRRSVIMPRPVGDRPPGRRCYEAEAKGCVKLVGTCRCPDTTYGYGAALTLRIWQWRKGVSVDGTRTTYERDWVADLDPLSLDGSLARMTERRRRDRTQVRVTSYDCPGVQQGLIGGSGAGLFCESFDGGIIPPGYSMLPQSFEWRFKSCIGGPATRERACVEWSVYAHLSLYLTPQSVWKFGQEKGTA